MKKITFLALAAISFAACNDPETEVTTTESDTLVRIDNTANNNAYAPAEGDVVYRERTVKVWRNGAWVDADNEVRLDNGAVVHRDGRVVKDGKEVELEEGEIVTRTGNFLDRTGQAIENTWKDVKDATKEAGKDIKEAVKDNN